jgi:hypothetical protein
MTRTAHCGVCGEDGHNRRTHDRHVAEMEQLDFVRATQHDDVARTAAAGQQLDPMNELWVKWTDPNGTHTGAVRSPNQGGRILVYDYGTHVNALVYRNDVVGMGQMGCTDERYAELKELLAPAVDWPVRAVDRAVVDELLGEHAGDPFPGANCNCQADGDYHPPGSGGCKLSPVEMYGAPSNDLPVRGVDIPAIDPVPASRSVVDLPDISEIEFASFDVDLVPVGDGDWETVVTGFGGIEEEEVLIEDEDGAPLPAAWQVATRHPGFEDDAGRWYIGDDDRAVGVQGPQIVPWRTWLGPDEPIQVTRPGVYYLTEQEYHQDPVPGGSLSSTTARALLPPSCPALADHARSHPTFKSVYDNGSVCHELVLGSGVELVEVVAADWRTKAAKDQREAARARGAVALLSKDMREVEKMAVAVVEHPIAGGLFQPGTGRPEVCLFWIDEETGMWCRAMLDWFPTHPTMPIAVDLKTTDDPSPVKIRKHMEEFGYFFQEAFYRMGLDALGIRYDDFLFVFVGKNDPYPVVVARKDQDSLADGFVKCREALDVWAQCQFTGVWPLWDGTDDILTISRPAWAK